jgi:hypothetical protein
MWGEGKEKEQGTYIGSKRKQPDGRRENDSRPKCTNCSRPWHDKNTCFAPGGGLAHLDSQARHKYIRDKQKERELGSAMMATATDEGIDNTEIERLKRECQEMKDTMKHAGLYIYKSGYIGTHKRSKSGYIRTHKQRRWLHRNPHQYFILLLLLLLSWAQSSALC